MVTADNSYSSWNFKAENSVHANIMMLPSPYCFITTYDRYSMVKVSAQNDYNNGYYSRDPAIWVRPHQ